VQNVPDVLGQGFPEIIFGVFLIASCELLLLSCRQRHSSATGCCGADLVVFEMPLPRRASCSRNRFCSDADRAYPDDGQVAIVQFIAHIDLPGDARQDLRQGLVERVQRDRSLNALVNVQVDLRVARQREKDFLRRNIGDDNAVGFRLGHRHGRRRTTRALRFAGYRLRLAGLLLDMLVRRLDRPGAATCKNHADGAEIKYVA